VIDGFLESIIVCILSFYFLRGYDYRTGVLASYQEAGSLCFTVLIILINLKVTTSNIFANTQTFPPYTQQKIHYLLSLLMASTYQFLDVEDSVRVVLDERGGDFAVLRLLGRRGVHCVGHHLHRLRLPLRKCS